MRVITSFDPACRGKPTEGMPRRVRALLPEQRIDFPRRPPFPVYYGKESFFNKRGTGEFCGHTVHHVMLPGKKHRMVTPSKLIMVPFALKVPPIGHTIARPARLGSLITASSGTSIHVP
ncbi:MAG: hypothetical protein JWP25_5030 [Bradyrhizobium sp.]|nr:hypothetical protein [Bradyrhizobium sp.]